MTLDSFIDRWSASGDAERANKDSFLNELCEVLGVERPHPKTGDPHKDLYVFEGYSLNRHEGSVPSAFQSWRETLAAYHLFDNERECEKGFRASS